MDRKRMSLGYFYAIATGVLGGFVPIIFQKALGEGDPMPRATALFIKFVASCLILLPFMIPKLKKVKLPERFGGKITICSILYMATLIFLYESYNCIPTGIGISLHYTFPMFTMILSAVLFKFRATKQSIIAMILSLVGVALLSSGTLSSDGAVVGILLALGSAVAYSAYFLWIEHTHLAEMDTMTFVTLKACGATVVLFFYVLVTGQLSFSVTFITLLGLVLSGACTIVSSFCLTKAIQYVGSVPTSILGSLEPIVCAVAGILILGEKISLRSAIGIAVVLIAAVLVTLSKQKKEDKSDE